MTQIAEREYTGWQDLYREKWKWDSVHWGTHCVDCYPGDCPVRVFVRNGQVWREEQSGTLPVIEEGVPDFNPMGCQKGASWSQSLYGPDRIFYPLKRAGERGEGKWTRISWDQAYTEIAESLIDTIENEGAQAIVHEPGPEPVGLFTLGRFFGVVGGHSFDHHASFNDFSSGLHLTFGKFSPVSSADDWFKSELVLIWHMNPVFTRIPFYHFIAEARYNGAEVVNISPDVNPSHTHADYQIPINGASDPAFGLALTQVMFAENIADWQFLKEQTDFGYLVRTDTRRYLRQTDVEGEGREDQMYQWVPGQGLKLADRGQMHLKGVDIALEGVFDVKLADGRTVQVTPVYAIFRKKLDAEYTPEKQYPITGVHPDVIRMLARKIATKKTNIMLGYNACKFYHGDLIERAMCLVLAASGNWGKHGTGIRCWAAGFVEGQGIAMAKPGPGAANSEIILAARDAGVAAMKAQDPTMTTEIAVGEMLRRTAGRERQAFNRVESTPVAGGTTSPPAFWWYDHGGYKERWNRKEWGDTSLPRSFDDYYNEAMEKGWWEGILKPGADQPPRVLFEATGDMLRRSRGGKKTLVENLWPKLKAIVVIDFRLSETAMYGDYFLPAAQHYEKITSGMPTPHVLNFTLGDRATEPYGESKVEWDILAGLIQKVAEVAAKRGLVEYTGGNGATRNYADLPNAFSLDGYYNDQDKRWDEVIRDTALAGTLPMGTNLQAMREKGHVRFTDWGLAPLSLSQASPLEPNKTHVPFRNHVEKGEPFPTFARRAQFYIDHEWWLESGEELPTYKPNPKMGGEYPLGMSSGHNRWSIHTMNQANKVILDTHRGEPHVMVSSEDASARGVKDDDLVRVFNDVGSFLVRAKVAPNVKPGQIISYNGWAPFQYKNWDGENEIEPGMVKWNGWAGGYGQLRYYFQHWQPIPSSRWTRCDFEKA
ncbi:MAG: molybdopterin-dependent oxidoreductase [Dehalococcoidia bacterium]|nr:molybdopterin-dependent oxidoreductase [Dehalococcoidia bacterium]